jgi:hypothetical protein
MPASEDPPLMTSLNDIPAADTLQKRNATAHNTARQSRSSMNNQ